MDITIKPQILSGTISAVPSKSQVHRLLICGALSNRNTTLLCSRINEDMEATAHCLNALGAHIDYETGAFHIEPILSPPAAADLYCRESGSTLRFLLPVAGALGVDATFHLEGRLPHRPLSPLWEEMERMGCCLTRPAPGTIRCTGQLRAGAYRISGNISSQFITGLILALSILPGTSSLEITSPIESQPYIHMTQDALRIFQADQALDHMVCRHPFTSPGIFEVEGDWSSAAYFLTAAYLGQYAGVTGLNPHSFQGDRVVLKLLKQLQENCTIDCRDVPDLVPILAIAAAAQKGATFTGISRLRLKESDRVATVAAMLQSFGSKTHVTQDTLEVFPSFFSGCTIDPAGDHRIAMAAAIGATIARGPVTILGAECVRKSYPGFWEDFRQLGGSYEQCVR